MTLNYPVGETVEEGLELAKIEKLSFLNKFFVPSFSGYIAVTIEGFSGIEEGVLFFREGTASGAAFCYDNFDIAVFGDVALESFFNSLAAQKGVIDVFRLSRQQIDLILALDERTSVNLPLTKIGIEKKIRKKYDSSFAQAAVKGLEQVITPSSDLLKKIGLGEMVR